MPTTTFVPPTVSRAAFCPPVCISLCGADGKPAVIRQGAGLAASPVSPTGAAPPLSSSTHTQININNILSTAQGGGGCLETYEVVCKEKQLKTSLAFSLLFIPARLVIKLKIHVPFRVRSVLSTELYILKLLWSVPLEIWGALATSLICFLSVTPQCLLRSPRGSGCWRWARRAAGIPQAMGAEYPRDHHGHPRCRSPEAADSRPPCPRLPGLQTKQIRL